jgi:hypothetical protein
VTHRIGWADVPDEIQRAIAGVLGSEIVGVAPVTGGFSPCLAATLQLASGGKAFVKAVSAAQNPDSPDFVRHELAAVAALPADLDAPHLIGSLDDGEWVVVVFEHVDGRLPREPWAPAELDRALGTLARVNASPASLELATAADKLTDLFDGWRLLVAADTVPAEWHARAEQLVALEQRALELVDGDRLVHLDVRADNMLVTPSGGVVLVDWAHACRGPSWLDLVLWLPALELEGGGSPEATLATVAAHMRPPPDALVAVVAGLAGYFLQRGGLPDPPGLPTLRSFQLAQARPALAWLDRLLPANA